MQKTKLNSQEVPQSPNQSTATSMLKAEMQLFELWLTFLLSFTHLQLMGNVPGSGTDHENLLQGNETHSPCSHEVHGHKQKSTPLQSDF